MKRAKQRYRPIIWTQVQLPLVILHGDWFQEFARIDWAAYARLTDQVRQRTEELRQAFERFVRESPEITRLEG